MKARINPDTGLWEVSELGEPRKGWMEFIQSDAPSAAYLEVVEPANPEVVDGAAHQRWTVRPKTEQEKFRVWTKSEFKDRVDRIAPAAWPKWRELRNSGNEIAVTVWEDGWLTYSEIENNHPKTLAFMQAFTYIGVLTSEESEEILHGP